jgi:Protein of unknown function (DUF1822)
MFSELIESTDWTWQIPQDRQAAIWQQSRTVTTAWGRWNAYLNQLCLETCLNWFRAEYLPTATAGMEPVLWELVNGSIITVGNIRIALIPTEEIDRSQLVVPQEWVDIPSWAADYYLGVQIDPGCQSLAIYGYTTHQQLKTANYDAQDRTYCLDREDLIPDLNALWLSYPRYTTSQTRASLPALPSLPPAQAEQLIARLGNPDLIMPRLEVPFPLWAALLEHPQWCQRLSGQQSGNSSPGFTQLNRWLQGQIDEMWQSLDRVLLPQQLAIAVRSTPSSTTSDLTADVYQAKLFDINGGQIALLVGVSPIADPESRISLQVHPAGGATYLPGSIQLRLLTIDGSEIGMASAAVTETIQLQFRAITGEQFEVEIACGEQTFRERFEV